MMKQLVFLLLFVIGFSSIALAKPAVIVPAVTTQNLTANTLEKGGLWSKIKTKVHQFFEMIEDEAVQIAVIAHITIIGLIIAIVMNADKKSELATFYIRQVLGISVLQLAILIVVGILSFIPVVGFIASLAGFLVSLGLLVLLIISLLSAIKGEQKELPVVGKMFQKWFASIG